MTEKDQEWDRLINGLRSGDQTVITEFYNAHGQILKAIAENQLAAEMRRRIAPSDIVQSALRSFFRRAEEGRFQFQDSEKLWSLMCGITLTKVREHVRYHERKQRDYRRETHPDDSPAPDDGFDVFEEKKFSPEASVIFADLFQQLMESLDEEEQQVVQLKLDDQTNDQIAEALGISERTVRRIMKRLQSRFERMFGDE